MSECLIEGLGCIETGSYDYANEKMYFFIIKLLTREDYNSASS